MMLPNVACCRLALRLALRVFARETSDKEGGVHICQPSGFQN